MTTNDIVSALRVAGIPAERRLVGAADVVWTHEGDASAELGSHGELVFVEFHRKGWPAELDSPTATYGTIDEAIDAVRKWFGKPA